jgi:hypothetical protein
MLPPEYNKKLPSTQTVEGSWIFNCYLYSNRGGDHFLKNDLKRHCVSTTLVSDEELTIALKFAIFKLNLMIVIVTMERKVERIEPEALTLLGVTLCFFDLSYHSRIHLYFSFRV